MLALLAAGYTVHYLVYCIPQPFFIEDAGISFAYARNLVDGEGLVTFRGGERVEGYSNALWTFLLAGFYALGVPLWTSSKLMGAVFGVLTLPIAFLLVRQARPGKNDDVALVAPLMLAASPQFVVWNSSGLENSLFCLLLASATWRLVAEMQAERDGRSGGFPWSALLYFLLSMTRPEGLMYAGIGLFGRVLGAVAARRPLVVFGWLAVFSVPFGIYNAWRYWYFAWPFPNTYYAKLGKKTFYPYNWTGRGWKYVKHWFLQHSVVYMLPLLGLCMTGFRRWRKWISIGLLMVLSVLLLWDGRAGIQDFEPDWWIPIRREFVKVRVWTIAGSCALLGLVTLRLPGWRARGLLWTNACAGVFFALYSGGDWMKAHRWFNLVSVSLFPVLAIGLGELLDALPGMALRLRSPKGPSWLTRGVSIRMVLVLLGSGYWLAQEAWHSNDFANDPETAVRDVHRRVVYMSWVQERLDLDHVTLLDVDMGAHVYFTDWGIADIAGLVDVSIARHRKYPREFMREYLFEERVPDFAHVHGGWARSSKIPTHKEWKERYFEIPGYTLGGRRYHIGNHVRKALFITDVESPAPNESQLFGDDVSLVSLEVPSPVLAAGTELWVDTWWQSTLGEDFEVLVFLDDGEHRTVQAVEPGYGWYAPEDWAPLEQIHGRLRVPLPADLPTGSYKLGVVVLDGKTGEALAHQGTVGHARHELLDGAPSADASVFLPGEWLTGVEVRVVSQEEAYDEAELDRAAAVALAQEGDCDAVWPRFKEGTRHVLGDTEWKAEQQDAVRSELAACYAQAASLSQDQAEQARLLIEGRRWDRHQDDLEDAALALAGELVAEGDTAFEAGDFEAAYAAYRPALQLDPSRSWVRRRAEEARDHRLGLVEVEVEKPEPAEVEEASPSSVKPAVPLRSKAKSKSKSKSKAKRPPPAAGQGADKGYIDGKGDRNKAAVRPGKGGKTPVSPPPPPL